MRKIVGWVTKRAKLRTPHPLKVLEVKRKNSAAAEQDGLLLKQGEVIFRSNRSRKPDFIYLPRTVSEWRKHISKYSKPELAEYTRKMLLLLTVYPATLKEAALFWEEQGRADLIRHIAWPLGRRQPYSVWPTIFRASADGLNLRFDQEIAQLRSALQKQTLSGTKRLLELRIADALTRKGDFAEALEYYKKYEISKFARRQLLHMRVALLALLGEPVHRNLLTPPLLNADTAQLDDTEAAALRSYLAACEQQLFGCSGAAEAPVEFPDSGKCSRLSAAVSYMRALQFDHAALQVLESELQIALQVKQRSLSAYELAVLDAAATAYLRVGEEQQALEVLRFAVQNLEDFPLHRTLTGLHYPDAAKNLPVQILVLFRYANLLDLLVQQGVPAPVRAASASAQQAEIGAVADAYIAAYSAAIELDVLEQLSVQDFALFRHCTLGHDTADIAGQLAAVSTFTNLLNDRPVLTAQMRIHEHEARVLELLDAVLGDEREVQIAAYLSERGAVKTERLRNLAQLFVHASSHAVLRTVAYGLAEFAAGAAGLEETGGEVVLAGKGSAGQSSAADIVRDILGVCWPEVPVSFRGMSPWDLVCAVQRQFEPCVSFEPDGRLPHLSAVTLYAEARQNLPVNARMVLWESNVRASTSCNPLALCREMLEDPRYADFTHVWVVKPGTVLHPSLLGRDNVRFVREGSFAQLTAYATAGYMVTNSTFPPYFVKRSGQRVLNTWHGIPWKKMGLDTPRGFGDAWGHFNVGRNMLQADLLLAPNEHTARSLTFAQGVGELVDCTVMLTDQPRNDTAVNLSPARREEILRRLGVMPGEKVVVFMPTWKGTLGGKNPEIEETLEIARGLAGEGYKVVLRAHHYVREAFKQSVEDVIVYAPDSIDTYELLGVTDVLVSDFSSVLLDAARLGIPVVKVLTNLEQYREKRGLYFAPDGVPGANAYTLAETQNLVRDALRDPAGFIQKWISSLVDELGEKPVGMAAKNVLAVFIDGEEPERTITLPKDSRPKVLLQVGGLLPNGLTASVKNAVTNLSSDIQFIAWGRYRAFRAAQKSTQDKLYQHSVPLPYFQGNNTLTRFERVVYQRYLQGFFPPAKLHYETLRKGMQVETRRMFGNAVFSTVVDYAGYEWDQFALFALGLRARTERLGFVFHNDYLAEERSRFAKMAAVRPLYAEFDWFGSVSEGVKLVNDQLIQQSVVDTGKLAVSGQINQTGSQNQTTKLIKHTVIPNTMDLQRMRSLAAVQLPRKALDWYAKPGKHVIVLARFSPEKNHAALLDALREYYDLNPACDIFLSFVGDGYLRDELLVQRNRLQLDSCVKFWGITDNPFKHIAASDVMMLPSKYEGQPMVFYEALALGKPVFAGNNPGTQGALAGGRLGTIVEPNKHGLLTALQMIAADECVSPTRFDAETYNEQASLVLRTAILGE